MNDNTFKMVLQYEDKKVYIDFSRGYDDASIYLGPVK